ncbi:MAG: signal peptidase I [Bacillota bacterium]
MTEDIKLDDYFKEENVRDLKDIHKAEIQYKKLQRRIKVALFGLFVVAVLPLLFSRYQDFDIIVNSTLFIGVMVFILIYTLYTVFRFSHTTDFADEDNQTAVKKHAERMDLVAFVSTLFMMFVIINTFFIALTSVAAENSDSMLPTLKPGDDLLVWHYNVTYERFDIVVAKIDSETYYVKRIIGLPGETIRYEDNQLYVQRINSNVMEQIDEYFIEDSSGTCSDMCEFTLADDEVLLLGDNRDQSTDSRDPQIGPFTMDDLYGRVFYRIRPFDTIGEVE